MTQPKSICVFLNEAKNKCHIAIKVSPDLPHDASMILEKLTKLIPGRGGGNKDLAQGSIAHDDPEVIVSKAKSVIQRWKSS